MNNSVRLPNFFVIGSARSGTTGLYHNLVQHPEIYMPQRKELHFFSHGWHKGLDWYYSHFNQYEGEKVIGEASVSYTYPDLPDFFDRMRSVVGEDLKFIYLVRDPAVRAISHYHYYKYYSKNQVANTFKEAIEKDNIFRETSCYSKFIEQYESNFGKGKMLVVVFEEMINNQEKTLQEIFSFLGVNPSFKPKDIKLKTNQTFVPKSQIVQNIYMRLSRSPIRKYLEKFIPLSKKKRVRNLIRSFLGKKEKPSVPKEVESELRLYYETEIQRMEAILKRDLSIWRKPSN